MQPQKTLTRKQVTSVWYFGGLLHCVLCLYSLSTPPTCIPLPSYSRYISPLMDIKCFLLAALSWTYIRDTKSISPPINRVHTGTHIQVATHTYKPEHSNHQLSPGTAGCTKQPEDCLQVIKEGEARRGLRGYNAENINKHQNKSLLSEMHTEFNVSSDLLIPVAQNSQKNPNSSFTQIITFQGIKLLKKKDVPQVFLVH